MMESVSRRGVLRALGALGAGAALPGAVWAAQTGSGGPAASATVTVATTPIGSIGPAFAGLSYDKAELTDIRFFSPQNANAIGLFRLIGPSLLRIGGNTVDKTIWTPNGPGGIAGQVAPSDIDALAGFLRATGWQVLYGTNLAASTPALAAAEIAYAVQALGFSLYGIEIGNEPDLYPGSYFPATWDFTNYMPLWQSFVNAIRQQSPNVRLAGPATAANVPEYVAGFARTEKKNVILLTEHYYRGNGVSSSSTAPYLITTDVNLIDYSKQMLAVSQSVDVPYRFGEMNSFYAGGAPNVSDSYASALWVIDAMFDAATYGAQGINLHGGGSSPGYTPISDNYGVVVEARPIFYGVTLFTLAGQGVLLQTTIGAGGLNATAYAIQAASGALNIIISNKDLTQTLNVTIALPWAAPSAQMISMTAPSLTATSGVAIQGASIAPSGAFSPGAATPVAVSGASAACSVPPLTVALIQVAPPSAAPLTILSSASAAGTVAPASYASAYGSNLAAPVSIRDSASVAYTPTLTYTSPTQINFIVPPGISMGGSAVTIGTQSAPMRIANVAPGLFTLNSAGLAAAYALHVSAGNVQTTAPVYTVQNGAIIAAPLSLAPSTDQVYLILFGTGIRGAGANVTVSINGINAQVIFAGAQGGFPALDQVNVLVPPQLAGSGTVSIVLTAAGVAANPVTIAIQ